MRTKPQRLEHRHRRSYAEGARDIAGGGDDAALAAADDHRLGGKRRDRRASRWWRRTRRNRHGRSRASQARHGAKARRAAGRAARRCGDASARQSRQKLTATARPSGYVAFPIAAERAAGPRDSGRIDGGAIGEGDQRTLVGEHMLQHAGEKVGRCADSRSPVGRNPVTSRKRPSRSGSSAMKESA